MAHDEATASIREWSDNAAAPGCAAAPFFFGKVRRRCTSVLLSMAQEGMAHDEATASIREWSDNAAARCGCVAAFTPLVVA